MAPPVKLIVALELLPRITVPVLLKSDKAAGAVEPNTLAEPRI